MPMTQQALLTPHREPVRAVGREWPLTFTHGLRQQVLDEFSVIPDMQDAVDTLVHQLFLVIP